MASSINIDPAALKRNIDLIIAGVVALGLIGYGYMEYSATQGEREEKATALETATKTYNGLKEHRVGENFGLDKTKVSTDAAHGNQARADEAKAAFDAHLAKVHAKFTPLDIPDGIEVDPETGAIRSVTLLTGGTSYSDTDELTVTAYDRRSNGKGKGAKLKAQLRGMSGENEGSARVEAIIVEDGGSGYAKGEVIITIEGGGGMGMGMSSDSTGDSYEGSSDEPLEEPVVEPTGDSGQVNSFQQQPGMMAPGMAVMAGASMGASGDNSKARVGLDDNTFLGFMHTKIYGLQRQCKSQRIRLPKFEEEGKEFLFSFTKAWNEPEFESHEREIMSYQLAEVEALCQALFKANIHEIYNIRRLKIMQGEQGEQPSEEDALEYLPDAKFSLKDVKKFTDKAPGSRVMPYEVTFRGFSSELSTALEELYKSPVFFVVKNIAVIEATDVVDDFEEEEEEEMSLGGGGGRSMREAYGPMGRGGMPGYGTMPFGMQGFGFQQGEERKRRRPPSLLLDESPLKVTLRVNSIKRVHPDKDSDDAFAALDKAIEDSKKKDEEGSDDDLIGVDEDDDGFDAYDEKLTGHSDNDPNDKPTQEEVDAALADLEEEEDK